ncbi:DUF3152 domain-containing protein [Streptomyces sp. NPDC051636]|uniref:DUF3152 domain-containing protein n=1 Tax=Streptomyces sp. NPDC051636 TaxID=3365663 RepID=UPI0037A55305
MGRHSRRGPAPKRSKGDSADTSAQASGGSRPAPATTQDRQEPGQAPGAVPGGRPGPGPVPLPGQRRAPMDGAPGYGVPRVPEGGPTRGVPRLADGTPARGVPRFTEGTPEREAPRFRGAAQTQGGTPARGAARFPEGTPGQGVPRLADGTSAPGAPRFADGAPARGVPRMPDGTPAGDVPRVPGGSPAHGFPQARGGHPQQREPGGGWGEFAGRREGGGAVHPGTGAAGPGTAVPRQRQGGPGGPRKEYLDAFDAGLDEDDDLFASRSAPGGQRAESHVPAPGPALETAGADDDLPPTGEPAQAKGAKGRTFTGIAAAAVTTVLAVIVAGQVTDGHDGTAAQSQSATDGSRDARDPASRGGDRPTPSGSPSVAALTYEQKMGEKYPLSATLKGSGKFDAVPGVDKAPGKGRKYTYRVDVEQGLGLDGELFAEAVHKTLNDDRSWAHSGARTFERVYSGKPDFVITLAAPGTTADWCAKSGLDTTEDNVSCDSAATERVMINAYRWAQGSKTYGDKIHSYRQMLINHEVGHRLGYGHVTCDKDGEPAPVMQQQTKFLDHDGIHCLPNPWPYPKS